ncbi:hypothetical protein ACJX0J_029556, partial [Zea mays]
MNSIELLDGTNFLLGKRREDKLATYAEKLSNNIGAILTKYIDGRDLSVENFRGSSKTYANTLIMKMWHKEIHYEHIEKMKDVVNVVGLHII